MHDQTLTLPFHRHMLRALTFTLIAVAVTLALFATMEYLIRQDIQIIEPQPVTVFDVISEEPQDSSVRPIVKLPPPPQMKVPPATQPLTPSTGSLTETVIPNIESPLVETPPAEIALAQPDRGATPVVRYEPEYPIDASRNGTEGYVILRFDINELGKVENIEVIDAKPKRVFERSARRALSRWKYQPKMDNGQAVAQTNQTVMLTFSLQNNSN